MSHSRQEMGRMDFVVACRRTGEGREDCFWEVVRGWRSVGRAGRAEVWG